MEKLSGKQKRTLRATAHSFDPLFQIGKSGLNEAVLKEYENALERHELIKVSVLQNAPLSAKEAAQFIEEHSDITVVQVIGKVLVLFKRSSTEKYQKYSTLL
ncbi:ribosome assembly RNA-binding protein YhbY [Allofustis seminis]|uniref:ribosome assembly RNA-binding protein YhbY n=1 Tax=Allofustis seminis TaxID=166939 RepID=UPI000377A04B|nr:ribosome assembly RNA-binding protein YhbY [Allofustis seminis]